MTDSEYTNLADSHGLPHPGDARQDALIDLRASIDMLVQQAKDEALDDLGLCADAVKQKAARIRAFDQALVDLLPEASRDDAARFLRRRNVASLYSGADADLPF